MRRELFLSFDKQRCWHNFSCHIMKNNRKNRKKKKRRKDKELFFVLIGEVSGIFFSFCTEQITFNDDIYRDNENGLTRRRS